MTAAIGLRLAQRRGLRGSDVARPNAVALDIGLAKLGADVLGEHLESALGGGIAGDGLAAELAHHGADVDDLAVTLGDHARQAGLGNDKRGIEVDVDDATEVLGAHVEHRGALDDAGVVDQNVGRGAKIGLDLGDELGDDGLVGDVGNIAVSIKAQLAVVLLGLGDLVGVTGVKGNLGACLSERLGNGHADAIGGAGHERDLAVQAEAVHKIRHSNPSKRNVHLYKSCFSYKLSICEVG